MTRASGVLLHPTSLPGAFGSGDLGAHARRFVDWLVAAGQGLWQVLPLCPVGPGHSPYMSPSAFALEPMFIDPEALVQEGWIAAHRVHELLQASGVAALGRVDHALVLPLRMKILEEAATGFFLARQPGQHEQFQVFCWNERDWLEDYALFMALAQEHAGPWQRWPAELARRDAAALARATRQLQGRLDFWCFVQWVASRQWLALRGYANERGVQIVGDMPIFVAPHSVDVWAHPSLFDLQADGRPRAVAGVPPDYFSATGQFWGNPLYRWRAHHDTGFAWWIRRVQKVLQQADVVRIDHFRGFCEYWEIPAQAEDARSGTWMPGPGAALFEALHAALGTLPIIAEDLGVITEDVTALREKFCLPGMRVLQFAFGGGADNAYLPHNYVADTVVYTGTHDNDTTLGWFAAASEHERALARTWLKSDGREIGWDLIHAASQSVARRAIYPMQDVLELGSDARMNRPGIAQGCWDWRFDWHQVHPWQAARLRQLSGAHGRNNVVFTAG